MINKLIIRELLLSFSLPVFLSFEWLMLSRGVLKTFRLFNLQSALANSSYQEVWGDSPSSFQPSNQRIRRKAGLGGASGHRTAPQRPPGTERCPRRWLLPPHWCWRPSRTISPRLPRQSAADSPAGERWTMYNQCPIKDKLLGVREGQCCLQTKLWYQPVWTSLQSYSFSVLTKISEEWWGMFVQPNFTHDQMRYL